MKPRGLMDSLLHHLRCNSNSTNDSTTSKNDPDKTINIPSLDWDDCSMQADQGGSLSSPEIFKVISHGSSSCSTTSSSSSLSSLPWWDEDDPSLSSSSLSPRLRQRKRVTFHEQVTIISSTIDLYPEDCEAVWYTAEEYQHFKLSTSFWAKTLRNPKKAMLLFRSKNNINHNNRSSSTDDGRHCTIIKELYKAACAATSIEQRQEKQRQEKQHRNNDNAYCMDLSRHSNEQEPSFPLSKRQRMQANEAFGPCRSRQQVFINNDSNNNKNKNNNSNHHMGKDNDDEDEDDDISFSSSSSYSSQSSDSSNNSDNDYNEKCHRNNFFNNSHRHPGVTMTDDDNENDQEFLSIHRLGLERTLDMFVHQDKYQRRHNMVKLIRDIQDTITTPELVAETLARECAELSRPSCLFARFIAHAWVGQL